MTRARWIALTAVSVPVLAGAVIVSASLGPFGALAYGLLLIGGVNTRHLFRDRYHHEDFTPKGRHR